MFYHIKRVCCYYTTCKFESFFESIHAKFNYIFRGNYPDSSCAVNKYFLGFTSCPDFGGKLKEVFIMGGNIEGKCLLLNENRIL